MRPLPIVLLTCLVASAGPRPASAAALTPAAVNAPFPAASRSGLAAVARLQILLDRTGISPGAIDGDWGANTARALEGFQLREGLPVSGRADRETLAALERRAGEGEAIEERTLTQADVEGPFHELPEDIYARAELDCLCYEALPEKLGELFHTTPAFLARLNPDVDLARASAGDRLQVPAVRGRPDPGDGIARLVVHKERGVLRALDADGRLLLQFPVTIGAQFSESPDGSYAIDAIARDPTWHFQPKILESVDDSMDEAYLPPGPNNPVGLVWIALSKPTYGIHGTSAPSTIGHASSNGCVRLTNWDALYLAEHVREKLPVEFVK